MTKKPKSQKTAHGHKIPVPKKSEFLANLKKVGKKTAPSEDVGDSTGSTTNGAEKK